MNYYEAYERQKELLTRRVQKSISAGNAALYQALTDPELNNLADFQNPFRVRIQRKYHSGPSYGLRLATPMAGGSSWKGSTGNTMDESSTTPELVTYPKKTFGSQLKVYQDAIDDGANFVDVLNEQLELKMEVLKNDEDLAMTAGICSATMPAGLLTQITEIVLNCTTTGGDVLSVDMLNLASVKPKGTGLTALADMMVMHPYMRVELEAILYDQQQIMNMVNVPGGFQLMSWNGIPIYLSSNMSITQDFNGTSEGAETGGATGSIYLGESMYYKAHYNRELYTDFLGKTSSQFVELDFRSRITYVLHNWKKWVKLIGITLPVTAGN